MAKKSIFIVLSLILTIGIINPSEIKNMTNEEEINLNSNQPIEERVEDLLSRMTLEEKVAQMLHPTFSPMPDGIPPKKVKSWVQQGVGFLLIRYCPSPAQAARCTNQIQEWSTETRLGIPVIISMDSIHGVSYVNGATITPIGLGMAATRDVDLVSRLAAIQAEESRAIGVHQSLSPLADVGTDPRWGRVTEGFGEDPKLVSRMVVAQVEGFQGKELNEQGILATTKHFPGAGPEKDGVDWVARHPQYIVSTNFTFEEFHLPPFEAAIEAGTGAIMPYYSIPIALDQVPALGSANTLRKLLRQEMRYKGIICTDWGPVWTFGYCGYDKEEALRLTINAGADVLGGEGPEIIDDIIDLVNSGKISKEEIDNSVRRILEVKFKLGLFENPFVDPVRAEEIVGCEEHQQINLEAARKSITLLKNNGILPFSKNMSILVAGEGADSVKWLLGAWTGYPQTKVETPFKAIGNKVLQKDQIFYAGTDIAKAKRLASKVDIAIVWAGEEHGGHIPSWGYRNNLCLPTHQLKLIQAIHETGTPVVVVLAMARPYVIPWCAENVEGIVCVYHPGSMGGQAIADVLFGDYNPTGKLPVSMPRSMDQVLAQLEDVPFDFCDPLYEYGHGFTIHE